MIDIWPITIDENNIILFVEYEGDPIAHERPKFGKGGKVYTPEKTAKYKEALAWIIKSKMGKHQDDGQMLYGVQALFFRSNRQRIDMDNLLKTLFDAIVMSGFCLDDSKIRETGSRLYVAQANPRTVFIIYKVKDELLCGIPNKKYPTILKCSFCSKIIPAAKIFPSSRPKKYCSYKCSVKAKRISVICKECGKIFEIPRCHNERMTYYKKSPKYKYSRSYCSQECSIEHHKKLRRIVGKESDKWICKICGGRVSRKEYTRCRACKIKANINPKSNYWKIRHKEGSFSSRLRTEVEIHPKEATDG